jgi:AcrR family transcriptional regulator
MAAAVGERGYPDTTVGDVLQRARMSRRTFYQLFDNREHCFLDAYDQAWEEALARLDGNGRHESYGEHITAVLEAFLEYLAARPDFARLLVVEPLAAGAPGLERHERSMRELAQRLERSGREQSPDVPGEEVRLRCEATVGAVHRVVAARILEGRARELPTLAGELGMVVQTLAMVGV